MSIGSSNKITITPSWIGASRAESYNVWIDFNKNGTFESTELVFTKSKAKTATVSGTINIPSSALTGSTRMRVSMKYNASSTACEAFANGEVEDYTINITSVVAKNSEEVIIETTEVTKLDFKLYPNPVKGDMINFSEMENTATSYRIYNQMGQQVANGYIENNSVNVGSLMPAIYIIEVADGKSVGTKRFIKE
nr:GEVED domain-containing protein [Flavobacterium lacisediminis]